MPCIYKITAFTVHARVGIALGDGSLCRALFRCSCEVQPDYSQIIRTKPRFATVLGEIRRRKISTRACQHRIAAFPCWPRRTCSACCHTLRPSPVAVVLNRITFLRCRTSPSINLDHGDWLIFYGKLNPTDLLSGAHWNSINWSS